MTVYTIETKYISGDCDLKFLPYGENFYSALQKAKEVVCRISMDGFQIIFTTAMTI